MIYPGTFDMVVLQGATFVHRFAWKSGVAKDPVDLTGATARMQVRHAKQAPAVLLEASTDDGRLVVETPLEGLLHLELPAALTDTLDFRSAVYDLEVEMPDGTVHRLLEGRIRVDQQVTR